LGKITVICAIKPFKPKEAYNRERREEKARGSGTVVRDKTFSCQNRDTFIAIKVPRP
jgi:hypothetical protein